MEYGGVVRIVRTRRLHFFVLTAFTAFSAFVVLGAAEAKNPPGPAASDAGAPDGAAPNPCRRRHRADEHEPRHALGVAEREPERHERAVRRREYRESFRQKRRTRKEVAGVCERGRVVRRLGRWREEQGLPMRRERRERAERATVRPHAGHANEHTRRILEAAWERTNV